MGSQHLTPRASWLYAYSGVPPELENYSTPNAFFTLTFILFVCKEGQVLAEEEEGKQFPLMLLFGTVITSYKITQSMLRTPHLSLPHFAPYVI